MPIYISDAAGSTDAALSITSDDVYITNGTSNKDIILKINKGGSSTEALRIAGEHNAVVMGGAYRGAQTYSKQIFNIDLNDNAAAQAVLKFMIPNGNHNAGIKVLMVITINNGKNTKIKEHFIAIARATDKTPEVDMSAGTESGIAISEESGPSTGYELFTSTTTTLDISAGGSSDNPYEAILKVVPNSASGTDLNVFMVVEIVNRYGTGVYAQAIS